MASILQLLTGVESRQFSDNGVDLTQPIVLNQNPLDIDKNVNIYTWNFFQSFLQRERIVNDPRLNSSEGYQKAVIPIIQLYNSSLEKFPNYEQLQINNEAISATQKYHLITNPGKIIVDGILGSQTTQMRYPEPVSYYLKQEDTNSPISTEGFIPVIWGNKRYVVGAKLYDFYIKQNLSVPTEFYRLYEPSLDRDLQMDFIPSLWYTLGLQTTINSSAEKINRQQRLSEQVKELRKTETKITNSILNK